MRVFCDTSVLIAASLQDHVHHVRAKAALERIVRGEDVGICSGHSLAETFSVLVRMPTKPKLQPSDVLAMLEKNIFPHFEIVVLEPDDYRETIRAAAQKGFGGGRIFDLLHIRSASQVLFDQIYTLNEREWQALAPELAGLISAPPQTVDG
jgi:predicted nucleic acid-binding protein